MKKDKKLVAYRGLLVKSGNTVRKKEFRAVVNAYNSRPVRNQIS